VPNKLSTPITDEQVYAAAALTAVGLSSLAIMRRAGITHAALRDIKARGDWNALLAYAESCFDALLKGRTF